MHTYTRRHTHANRHHHRVRRYFHQTGVPHLTCMNYEAIDQACTPENTCRTCSPDGTCSAITNFTNVRGSCRRVAALAPPPRKRAPAVAPPQFFVDEYGQVAGEADMMAEIYARGPISCGIDAGPIETYTGGIFYDHTGATAAMHCTHPRGGVHATRPHPHPHPQAPTPSITSSPSWAGASAPTAAARPCPTGCVRSPRAPRLAVAHTLPLLRRLTRRLCATAGARTGARTALCASCEVRRVSGVAASGPRCVCMLQCPSSLCRRRGQSGHRVRLRLGRCVPPASAMCRHMPLHAPPLAPHHFAVPRLP